MAKVKFTNATTRVKAVRVVGGHEVIAPSASATIDGDWDDVELDRYRAAGLQVEAAKVAAKKADKAE